MQWIRNANVNAVDQCGQTLLMLATKHHQLRIVKVLLQHHADLTIKDKDGRTARDNIGSIARGRLGEETQMKIEEVLDAHICEP